ncbi:hypothetical protein BJ508DRAFT_312030 [Ascobolus immersus RN42]|uniref:Uncharacterized protein n=1 Tax=Ascobolus immersus RN42 TaxID=1160509 RepID=A0A3N4HTN3_ASCIM|nr:hypothetical protein BJ508DRAFT_312030 [Ascobolus immersus RN42]
MVPASQYPTLRSERLIATIPKLKVTPLEGFVGIATSNYGAWRRRIELVFEYEGIDMSSEGSYCLEDPRSLLIISLTIDDDNLGVIEQCSSGREALDELDRLHEAIMLRSITKGRSIIRTLEHLVWELQNCYVGDSESEPTNLQNDPTSLLRHVERFCMILEECDYVCEAFDEDKDVDQLMKEIRQDVCQDRDESGGQNLDVAEAKAGDEHQVENENGNYMHATGGGKDETEDERYKELEDLEYMAHDDHKESASADEGERLVKEMIRKLDTRDRVVLLVESLCRSFVENSAESEYEAFAERLLEVFQQAPTSYWKKQSFGTMKNIIVTVLEETIDTISENALGTKVPHGGVNMYWVFEPKKDPYFSKKELFNSSSSAGQNACCDLCRPKTHGLRTSTRDKTPPAHPPHPEQQHAATITKHSIDNLLTIKESSKLPELRFEVFFSNYSSNNPAITNRTRNERE